MALVTFEQPPFLLSGEEAEQRRQALAEEGVAWVPLRYHKRPALLSTLYDIVRGALRCLRLCLEAKARLVHARGTVPAAMGYLASRLGGALFLNDADGPLSEEYVDAGVWSRGGLAHVLTRRAEAVFLRSADKVAVLSAKRRAEIAHLVRGEITLLPCAVDTSHFIPEPLSGFREEMGLDGVVFVYAGKAGGWYLTDAMLDFVCAAKRVFGGASLLVLTTEEQSPFPRLASARKVFCVLRRASREEMPGYLSSCDVGLSFVLPAPSKRACSPVKNGEYLSCGLPIVTTPRIGDYSELVSERAVGVVVETLDEAGYQDAAAALETLLRDPSLKQRCRAVAKAEVGLSEIVIPRYLHLYEQLLGAPK